MVAQKCKKKKKIWQKVFAFFSAYYYPQTHLIKAPNFLDSSRPNGRISKNPKTGDFGELVLPGNDFKTCSTVNSSKKHPDFGGLKKT